MKFLLPILVAFIINGCNGLPKDIAQNYWRFQDFQPCRTAYDIQTLWPDFNNNRIFHQCTTVGRWGTHRCPEPLLFSFHHQVCVWEHQWRAPPPPDQITPFPLTTWPQNTGGITQTTTSNGGILTTLQELTTIPNGPTDGGPIFTVIFVHFNLMQFQSHLIYK